MAVLFPVEAAIVQFNQLTFDHQHIEHREVIP